MHYAGEDASVSCSIQPCFWLGHACGGGANQVCFVGADGIMLLEVTEPLTASLAVQTLFFRLGRGGKWARIICLKSSEESYSLEHAML